MSTRRRGHFLTAALLTSVLAGACSGGPVSEQTGAAGPPSDPDRLHAHHATHAAEVVDTPSGHSLFHLESEWWDQRGERRRLDSLAGSVQVVAMIYTHCAYACPRILADLKRIEAELGEEYAERVGFVLVSVDPERDTPERLAEFAGDLRLEQARWTLLASDAGATLELAAVLGVSYRRESATDFAHTNLLAVLSPTGELVHRQLGLGEEPAETLRTIRELVGGG